MLLALLCRKERSVCIAARRSSIHCITRPLSLVRTKSGEWRDFSRLIQYIGSQNHFCIGFLWSTHTDRLFSRIVCYIAINWLFHADFLLNLSTDIISEQSRQLCWSLIKITDMTKQHPKGGDHRIMFAAVHSLDLLVGFNSNFLGCRFVVWYAGVWTCTVLLLFPVFVSNCLAWNFGLLNVVLPAVIHG